MQYSSCSCCNVSHAATIQQSVASDGQTLTPCQLALAEAACRVCDPEVAPFNLSNAIKVGVGLLEKVCVQQCDNWYHECQKDYFAYDHMRSTLVPCSFDNQLICTQLGHFLTDGTAFCEHMGFTSVYFSPLVVCRDKSG